jgi:hypothetical protein
MSTHPENDGPLNELIEFIEKQETIDVWCIKCQAFRKANSVFAKYLNGEISSCRFCRENK